MSVTFDTSSETDEEWRETRAGRLALDRRSRRTGELERRLAEQTGGLASPRHDPVSVGFQPSSPDQRQFATRDTRDTASPATGSS
jgi:hypothetical protein